MPVLINMKGQCWSPELPGNAGQEIQGVIKFFFLPVVS